MKSHIWKAAAVLTAVCALVFSLVHAAIAKPGHGDADERGLEGTWVVTVTQHDCSSGTPIGVPFESLLTFSLGGTLTETTSNPMFFPALRGPGHGVWNRTGWHTYHASSLAFITMSGALAKTQKITQTIDMGADPDSFVATDASVQFFDPAGNLLVTGCASATGKRFE